MIYEVNKVYGHVRKIGRPQGYCNTVGEFGGAAMVVSTWFVSCAPVVGWACDLFQVRGFMSVLVLYRWLDLLMAVR
eukprot:7478621-Heterocapsa_arctica.AAC.1